MNRKLLIRDLTLRDGQQSLFATRLSQKQVERVLPFYKDANFYAMEVWGGAVPDSIMRYLNEDPWYRLESIKAVVGDVSLLTALSRGRNLFGYNPYPDSVIEGFNRNAIKSGLGIMRIFDALNDLDNMRTTIKYVKENGGIADCCICYTVDPRFTKREKLNALLQGKRLNYNIFTDEYFLDKAKQLEEMGADMITIKDMAGLIPPHRAGILVRMLKANVKLPVDFHTHCTPGFGLASTLMAIINGVDIVDTNIMNFAGGTAAASYELIHLFCQKLGIDTGVNPEAVVKINRGLKEIRLEMADLDSTKRFPREFDITTDKLPPEIDQLFDLAIEYARAEKADQLLETTHKIEAYFNFPEPDEFVKDAEMPGGMYSNMQVQLKQLKLEKLLPRTLELIPMVRLASGCPPLVTPTSQIVGVQAVNCALDEEKGLPAFTTKSIQYVNLVKGAYGKTPVPVDPEFRFKIAGVREEVPYDTNDYRKPDNPVLPEYGGARLATNEKEELLLALFPQIATNYLRGKIEQRYKAELQKAEEEKQRKIDEEKKYYDSLSPEEKEKRLLQGLYSYHWASPEDELALGRS